MKLKSLALAAALFSFAAPQARAGQGGNGPFTSTNVFITELTTTTLKVTFGLTAATTVHAFFSTISDFSTLVASGASTNAADITSLSLFDVNGGTIVITAGRHGLLPNTTYFLAIASATTPNIAQIVNLNFGSFNAVDAATMTNAASPLLTGSIQGRGLSGLAAVGELSLLFNLNNNPVNKTTYTVTASTYVCAGALCSVSPTVTLTSIPAVGQMTLSGLLPNTSYFIQVQTRGGRDGAVASSATLVASLVGGNDLRLATFPAAPSTSTPRFTATVDVSSISVNFTTNGNPFGTIGSTVTITTYSVTADSTSLRAPLVGIDATSVIFTPFSPVGVSTGNAMPFAVNSTATIRTGLQTNTVYHFFAGAKAHGPAFSTFTFLGSTATLAAVPLGWTSDVKISTTPQRFGDSVWIQWGSNGNPTAVTTYTVVASTSSAFTAVAPFQVSLDTLPVATSGGNAVNTGTATVSGLNPLTTYFFQVRAHHRTDYRTTYTSLGSTVTLPAPVTALTVSSIGVNTLLFTWNDNSSSNTTGNLSMGQRYEVSLSSTQFLNNGTAALPITNASTTFTTERTSATFAGLATGTNFTARVFVISPFGLGVDRSTVTESAAVTTLSLQSGPAALSSSATFQTVNIASITVLWANNGLAAGTTYRVEMSTVSTFLTLNASSVTASTFAFFGAGTGMAAVGVLPNGIALAAGEGRGMESNPDNTRYFFRVQATVGGVASAFVDLGSTVTLAQLPPSLTKGEHVNTVFVSSAPDANVELKWGANGGPANPLKTLSSVERSTSSTLGNFTTVITSAAYFTLNAGNEFSHKPADLVGCTTYQFRVRHQNEGGVFTNYTPLGSGVLYVTSNTVPNPVPNFLATALSGNAVKLTWGEAGPEGVTNYAIYTDSGVTTLAFSTGTTANFQGVNPSATRIAVISSGSAREFTTGALNLSSSTTRFMITARHRCFETETTSATASVAIAITSGSLSAVRAAIAPLQGSQSNASNNLTLSASLTDGSPSGVSVTTGVVFQFKPAIDVTCNGRALLSGSSFYTIGNSLTVPYTVAWNLANACGLDSTSQDVALPAGTYNLRAVAFDSNGSSDTAPTAISVVVVPPTTPSNLESVGPLNQAVNGETLTLGAGEVIKQVIVSPGDAPIVTAAPYTEVDGTISTRSVVITLPINAFGGLPTLVTVLPNLPATDLPTLPSSGTFVGVQTRVILERPVAPGATVQYALGIPDADNDRVIDRSELRGDSARVYTNTPTNEALVAGAICPNAGSTQCGDGTWKDDTAASYDPVNKRIVAIASHFSFSAIGGVVRTTLDLVRVYPVPFKPNGANADEGRPFIKGDVNTGIMFDNLPTRVTVKIYTLTGNLVAKASTDAGTGRFQWDVRNDAGRNVASGGYFAVISSPGLKSVVKRLAIIR